MPVQIPTRSGKLIEELVVCSVCHARGEITKVTCRTFKRLF